MSYYVVRLPVLFLYASSGKPKQAEKKASLSKTRLSRAEKRKRKQHNSKSMAFRAYFLQKVENVRSPPLQNSTLLKLTTSIASEDVSSRYLLLRKTRVLLK